MTFRFSALLCTTLLITSSFTAQADAQRTFSVAKRVSWGLYAP
ncbi:deoxyribonuclease, partial [Pseudomonas syringae pv. tagetis]